MLLIHLSVYLIIATAFIAAVRGMRYWKGSALSWRLVTVEVALAGAVQSAAHAMMMMKTPNWWLLNSFMITDVALLGAAGILLLRQALLRRAMAYVLCLSLIVCLASMAHNGITGGPDTITFLATGTYLCVLYLLVLFQVCSGTITPMREPALWLCLAILVYFVCDMPFMSFFHFLAQNTITWQQMGRNFTYINAVLAILRYGLIAYAFSKMIDQRWSDASSQYLKLRKH